MLINHTDRDVKCDITSQGTNTPPVDTGQERTLTSFKTVNPFAIKRELDKLCGPLKSAKPLRSGSLPVETDTGPQATLLMRARVLHGSPVTVQ